MKYSWPRNILLPLLALLILFCVEPAHAVKYKGKMKLEKNTIVDNNYGTESLPNKYSVTIDVKKISGGVRITVDGDYGLGNRTVDVAKVAKGIYSMARETFPVGLPAECRVTSTIYLAKYSTYALFRFTDNMSCNDGASSIQYTYNGQRLNKLIKK